MITMSYKGKILIAKPSIVNDIFYRAVVYIVEHNSEGSYGVILNKRNTFVSSKISKYAKQEVDIYDGGPVKPEQLYFIIKGVPYPTTHIPLDDEHFFTSDISRTVNSLTNNTLSLDNVKAFLGYSGWDAGQLDTEVAEGHWYIADAPDFSEILSDQDSKFWKRHLEQIGGECLIWANAPSDILMN